MDRHYAGLAGFEFIPVEQVSPDEGWLPHLESETNGGAQ